MRVLAFFLSLVAGCGLIAQQTPPSPYLKFSEAERRLTELARQHADVLTLETIGQSPGGRKIHAVRIAARGLVDPARRPAIFVGANIAGFHNAATQAAIGLIESLAARKAEPLLTERTFYIAPMLNPDAQDSPFGAVRLRSSLNASQLDRDRDGLIAEDGPDDLNGDGRITQMRIADPQGEYIADPADLRSLRRADPLKGEKGQYRLYTEGNDDDADGQFNEDPTGGFRPDKNFAHAWSDSDPESGPFPSFTPESKAVMDYLLKRRNVALALVYGPANNLLEMPRGSGAATDVGQVRVRPPAFIAAQLGLDTARDYTVDEIWNLAQGSALAAQAGPSFSRDQLASILGAGAANSPAQEDLRYYQKFAEDYKKILDKAGVDSRRPGRQSQTGGLQNWLYYHYGALAVELDIWGIPRKKAPSTSASPVANALAADQADLFDYIDTQAKEGFVPWTEVTLKNGKKAEVGGVDPFVEIAPPAAELNKAIAAHTEFVLAASDKLARVQVLQATVAALSSNVWKVSATAGNTGFLPTHTSHSVRARTWLPVHLKLDLPGGATLVSGSSQFASERLVGGTGTVRGEWLVRAAAGARLTITVTSQNAGTNMQEVTLQ